MRFLAFLLVLLAATAVHAQPSLPISANNGPTTSAEFRGVITDPSGTGKAVFDTQTATGATTARTFADRFADRLNIKDYGAKCDGSTIDTAAINAWLAQVVATQKIGYVPAGTCLFDAALTPITGDNIAIVGDGFYQSVFRYVGAATSLNMLTVGSGTSASDITKGFYISGIKFSSATMLTGGFVLHLRNAINATIDNIVVDGVGGPGNMWGGVWGDWVGNVLMIGGIIQGQGDLILVNGATVASGGPRAQFILAGTRTSGINNATAIHVAGGFGGLICTSYTSHSGGLHGMVVDTTVTAEGNREIIIAPSCALDSTTGDNVVIDDTGPVTGGAGTLNLLGWIAGAGYGGGAGHNINIKNFKNGWVTIDNGPIWLTYGPGSYDNIRISDPSANYIFGTFRNTNASGWGVNCTVAIPNIFFQPGPILTGNTSGNVSSNCAPRMQTYANTTILDNSSSTAQLDVYNSGGSGANIKLDDANTPLFIRNSGGNFQVLNSAYNIAAVTIGQTGNAIFNGIVNASGGLESGGAVGLTVTIGVGGGCTLNFQGGLLVGHSGC
jgi:hypothetical protein